ncbi:DUF3100 domain-containing protein [Bifidobacterium tibiigranuli]|jgi:hypothetical protein|uniref:DUF3100 domain-containing protein n=1 Tax=Bifidobacterium tibiigranuli TaxID=2172043 RepID=UPI002356B2B5|nr:DUF3100 domain-containing protein [Bifidobacterium tibiigranuli]MCI1210932.1 DUF3100 domain-containing protein [Bifidobacterium tibiigranuli]MCI1220501.1 DUF3100 domain-containing protein [Bifidobacterium tibiigranuli]
MSAAQTESAAPNASDAPHHKPEFPKKAVLIVSVIVLLIAAVSQIAGPLIIPLGKSIKVTLLPMLWGLVIGTVVSAQKFRPFSERDVAIAQKIMDVAVLLLTARLAFTMGPSIMLLVHAGPALLLQELGHMFATILLALPLAVLLHMGPSTIGATFSIDREGSFAMVSERYGSGSPQYRGVLTMYIFGTLFGTILVGLIASVTSQLHIFNPLALAMGAGVGSGSMMAAATGAITAEHPSMANEVLAMAATSNVITGLIGVYVGVYVALPLAEKLYNKLAHDNVRPITAEISAAPSGEVEKKPESLVTMPTWVIFVILVVIGIPITAIATKSFTYQLVVGYLLVAALAAAGMALSKLTRNKVPAMVMIVTLGVIISSPISPIAKWVTAMTTPVDFLSICTVVLSIAGLTVGTKLSLLKGLGWKIIPVGLVSVAASYLLSVCVAELALGLWS